MVDIEIYIILTINAIIAGVGCIPFGLACVKQKKLRRIFLVYLSLAIGCFFSIFQLENFTHNPANNIYICWNSRNLFYYCYFFRIL